MATGENYRTTPFYELSPFGNEDLPKAQDSLGHMQLLDGSVEVFVVIAHDATLLDIVPFFPKKISDWDLAGYKPLGAWRFLKDFVKIVAGSQNDGA
jgi:hypothetical protein